MVNYSDKIVITGAAGLVGQNLVLLLGELGYSNILAIDKHEANIEILKQLNPDVTTLVADLAVPGQWQQSFQDATSVIILHAQITSLYKKDFVRNNLVATENVIHVIQTYKIPYIIHISSSVVKSVVNDNYTWSKIKQEEIIKNSGISYCILRPTLMFGWFDPKHLGWLARFMQRCPIFPIPGTGEYLRQPLYSRDFCRIIVAVMKIRPKRQVFDITGQEGIYYVDIIRLIKKTIKANTIILKVPYGLFLALLKFIALFWRNPPFTADQLKALTAGDYFSGEDMRRTFNVIPTKLEDALKETFCHSKYSKFILQR